METSQTPIVPAKPPMNINGIVFGILIFAYQIMICLFYGFWFRYQPDTLTLAFDEGELFLVCSLTILVVIGTS